jgi:glycosyltransferase involved in cell wall biosynthesis
MTSSLMLLSNPLRTDPRVVQEARAIRGAGIEVHILAWDRDGLGPRRESRDGVDITRTGPACPFRAPIRVFSRLPAFWASALIASRDLEFDVVHSHDLDTLPLGIAISRLHGKPLLYDAHEIYSKMVSNEVGPLQPLVWAFEKCMMRRADVAITVGRTLATIMDEVRGDAVRIVTTSPDPAVAEGASPAETRRRYGLGSGFLVSYLGSLEPGRFIEEAMSTFEPGGDATFVVAGDGSLRGKVEAVAAANPAVKYIGLLDADEALRVTLASDLVMAMMDPRDPINVIGTPGKVINAMALRRPVISTKSVAISKTIEDADCGYIVAYDAGEFSRTVSRAGSSADELRRMGERGRECYEREFSWERSRGELLAAYRTLVGPI